MTVKALVIPAAGAGKRMQKETPKPYLQLAGSCILEHTIRRFTALEGLEHVVIATSQPYLAEARQIIQEVLPDSIAGRCVTGGESRQHSIYNALRQISNVDLVLVHDAVRPFVQLEHIKKCCRTAWKVGGAVLGIPAKDTIKKVDNRQVIQETPDREYLWQSQTPQVFQLPLLLKAYERALEDKFVGTDDASLVERVGARVQMVEGDQSNFKITYPLDLKLAKLLMEERLS